MDPKNVPKVKLNNGTLCPIVGLGTFEIPADGNLYKVIRKAIDYGYRLFDCALVYGNQEEIGRALNDAINEGKVDNDLHPKDANGKLIDGKVDFVECYQGLEDCLKAGLVKSIGVSNFNKGQIEKLLKETKTKPVTNQVECHPYLCQKKLKQFCEEKGISFMAYSPLGSPGTTGSVINAGKKKYCLLKEQLILNLANKYKKNTGQILLKFHTERNTIVVTKSVRPERIKSNISLFDFKPTVVEIIQMEGLDRNYRSNPFEQNSHITNYPFPPNVEY